MYGLFLIEVEWLFDGRHSFPVEELGFEIVDLELSVVGSCVEDNDNQCFRIIRT